LDTERGLSATATAMASCAVAILEAEAVDSFPPLVLARRVLEEAGT
jgi:hypothetical protein